MTESGLRYDTVVLDVDGTLVDTVYQHVVIWAEAFAAHDVQEIGRASCRERV